MAESARLQIFVSFSFHLHKPVLSDSFTFFELMFFDVCVIVLLHYGIACVLLIDVNIVKNIEM